MIDQPRAYTTEEIRDQLLTHFRNVAKYWATLRDPDMTVDDRCDGVAFSVLAALDGTAMALPAFDLVVMPHEDDKQYHIDNGENWYEPGTVISEMLHEHFYKKGTGK